jgi:polar amino acid transport system substrate-binding protein
MSIHLLLLLCCKPPAEPAPAISEQPERASGFAGLKERGVLTLAADPRAAPFLSRTKTGFEGFEYEIVQAIAQAADVPLVIVEGPFDSLVERVAKGEADLAIGQISPSSSYKGVFWSVSYLQYSMCLVTPDSSTINTMEQLAGKKVGMYDDPAAWQLANVLIGASYTRVLFSDYGYFDKLVAGELDGMVYDCPLARHELKPYWDKLKIAQDNLSLTTYNIAVSEKDGRLLSEVNKVLQALGEQGTLASLEERWLQSLNISPDASGKVVMVRAGESLPEIARRELGDESRWKELYLLNKDLIGRSPDGIYAGMRLRLPKKAL